jgi:hypothetical protein
VEIPFEQVTRDASVQLKERLQLAERLRLEENLAQELSTFCGKRFAEGEIIIDLPEPISFESGLFIADENCFFSDGSSVFRDGNLNDLVKSLRIIRVFVDPEREGDLKNCQKGILKILQKLLKLG